MEEKDNNTQENEIEKQKTESANGEKQNMVIEISKYKRIVETFNQPSTLAKLVIVCALLIVLVFAGIAAIALVMKNYYPYKMVNTNEYGATIIQNEDNEVIYWLLNSADLWANSGIEVHKGDVISVHTSGAFHSSIHHLVGDADTNRMGHNWIKPTGGQPSENPRDSARGKYRITKEYPFNTLLMQVIPESIEIKNGNGEFCTQDSLLSYLDGQPKSINNSPDIYVIGDGKDNITIRTNGILHFTVNDIVLTKRVIDTMLKATKIGPVTYKDKNDKDSIVYKDTGALKMGHCPHLEDFKRDTDYANSLKQYLAKKQNHEAEEVKNLIKCLDDYIKSAENDTQTNKNLNELIDKCLNELDYYHIMKFVDAWYVDNVGSFLIVIERKKQQ